MSIGTIVMTTHVSTNAKCKLLQLEELIKEFKRIREHFLQSCDVLEIYLTGDYNLCYSDDTWIDVKENEQMQALYYLQKELELTRINRGKPTNLNLDRCLDHIWMWRGVNPNAQEKNISMESLMQNIIVLNDEPQKPWVSESNGSCPREKGLLADHLWQGIIVKDLTPEEEDCLSVD